MNVSYKLFAINLYSLFSEHIYGLIYICTHYFKVTKDLDNTICRKLIVFHSMTDDNMAGVYLSHSQAHG